jgi:ribonuclease HII
MIELDKQYPNYGFASHKGYITALHTDSIRKHGVLPIHRKSFSNISALLG